MKILFGQAGSFYAVRLVAAWLCLLISLDVSLAQSDFLPSWNEGVSKQAILDFVEKVTTKGNADFVEPEKRIAVFDNDGTLWAEQPMYFQLAFALDEIKRLAPQHPEWENREPFKSVLAGDLKGLGASGKNGLLDIIAVTHAGMTTVEFSKIVKDWLETARHPSKHRPYEQLVYKPQLELLSYLRSHGFKTFIVSGGGVEFMRVFAEKAYGIPPEQVVGSFSAVKFRSAAEGGPDLLKEPDVEFIDDGAGKPVGINRFIGRKPIFAFGNSDGDKEMLEYVTSARPSVGLILHHTDAEREWAYDRQSHFGKLDKALDEAGQKGWLVIDMKADWKEIFAGQ